MTKLDWQSKSKIRFWFWIAIRIEQSINPIQQYPAHTAQINFLHSILTVAWSMSILSRTIMYLSFALIALLYRRISRSLVASLIMDLGHHRKPNLSDYQQETRLMTHGHLIFPSVMPPPSASTLNLVFATLLKCGGKRNRGSLLSPVSVQWIIHRRGSSSKRNPSSRRIRMSTSYTIRLYHWGEAKTRAAWFSVLNHSQPEEKKLKNTGSPFTTWVTRTPPSICSVLHQKPSLSWKMT